MDYPVPSFGVEEDDPLASSLGFPNNKWMTNSENALAEIVWKDGPVLRRFSPPPASENLSSCCSNPVRSVAMDRGISHVGQEAPCELFMGEDEMASWLQCPIEDSGRVNIPESSQQDDLGRPLLSHERQANSVSPLAEAVVAARPTAPRAVRESTVVESNMTPPDSRMAAPPWSSGPPLTWDNRTGAASSSGAAGDGAPSGEHRKRKAHELDDSEGEDAGYDSDRKKDTRKPARRSRAAEVHNLSERRRRDRINEKMKALQQLIPRCNKSDKASMLDDAVEYLKSLQLQIQMMSMGCAITPMMFPSFPQYAPTMGMGMESSTGSLSHPMASFSSVMPGTPIPVPAAGQFAARMPMHAFHPAPMAFNGQLRVPATGQPEPATNMICLPNSNPALVPAQTPPLPDPYCQFMGLQRLQTPQQNQTVLVQEGTSKASNLNPKTENSKQGSDG